MRFFGSGTKAARSEAEDALALVLVPNVPVASMPHPAGWPCRTKRGRKSTSPLPASNRLGRSSAGILPVLRHATARVHASWCRACKSRETRSSAGAAGSMDTTTPPEPPGRLQVLVWRLCMQTPPGLPTQYKYLW
ncbi:hypothetical protein TrVGV298_004703 [Trichoderma virens]|nr:hypothetical protein TrVGV298_004703 [Trichoderma virens]